MIVEVCSHFFDNVIQVNSYRNSADLSAVTLVVVKLDAKNTRHKSSKQ